MIAFQRRRKREVVVKSCCTCNSIGTSGPKQVKERQEKKELKSFEKSYEISNADEDNGIAWRSSRTEKKELKSYETSYEISDAEKDNGTALDYLEHEDYDQSEAIGIPDDRSYRKRRGKFGNKNKLEKEEEEKSV